MNENAPRLALPEPDDSHPLDWYPGDGPEYRTLAEANRWVDETLAYEDSRAADHGAVVGVVVEPAAPCIHVRERERRRWDQRVYFFKCVECGLIKIGTSHDYRRRRRQIERTSDHVLGILGTVFGDRSTEAALHGTFTRERAQGEWFRPSAELLRYIEDNAASEPARRGRR